MIHKLLSYNKLYLTTSLLLCSGQVVQAQVQLRTVGPILGYATLKVSSREQLVGRFPVYMRSTDMDNIRAGIYAEFALPKSAFRIRPEVSYLNHSIKSLVANPDQDMMTPGMEWEYSSGIYNYKRFELVPLLVWQHRYWQVQGGPFGWYRISDPSHRQPDPYYNRYIFSELDHAIAPWIGGYKIGGGLTFGRLHADINYSHTVSSVTRNQIVHQGQSLRFFRMDASSFTYDVRFDVYRRKPTTIR